MINLLSIGTMDMSSYGAYVVSNNAFDAPQRVYEKISVPGRNGDLLFDNKQYENKEMLYTAIFARNFDELFDQFRGDLLSLVGYQRIVDSVHPNEYRLGYVDGEITAVTLPDFNAGKCTFTMNCKPQRFLLDSQGQEISQTFTRSGTITNPTKFDAYPILRVYGYGTLGVGSTSVIISQHPHSYVEIDSDMQDVQYNGANANQYVRFVDDMKPTLSSGSNGITLANTMSRVEVEPRWWTL